MSRPVQVALPPTRRSVRIKATNLSGDMPVEDSFDRRLTAEDLTKVLVNRMGQPRGEYRLFNSTSGRWLDEQVEIGSQVAEEDDVTVYPSTHLGG